MGTDELLSVDEGILLLQDEPEASVAGYIVDYWRQTALSRHNTMMYQVKKAEIVNGQYSTTSDADPYVAFRTHRTRMQTRRNRKGEEQNYEKMTKLKRDFEQLRKLMGKLRQREEWKQDVQVL